MRTPRKEAARQRPATPAKHRTVQADAVKVRAARREDFTRLAQLAGELGYPATREDIARRFAAIEASPEHAAFIAEFEGREVAGCIGLSVQHTLECDPRVEVTGLVVDQRFRSQRIGWTLLARAEEWGREHGCREIGLRSNVIRERAHAFYERNGYIHYKTQKAFRKEL
jgi:GNAT superfamily N-acetyltransferase